MTAERERLPNLRPALTFDIESEEQRYAVTIGWFPDGRPAEVFLSTNGRAGSHADTIARDAAIVASIALQHGASVETLRRALCRDAHGRPSGALGVALDMIAAELG
jgi:hypothetical protein